MQLWQGWLDKLVGVEGEGETAIEREEGEGEAAMVHKDALKLSL